MPIAEIQKWIPAGEPWTLETEIIGSAHRDAAQIAAAADAMKNLGADRVDHLIDMMVEEYEAHMWDYLQDGEALSAYLAALMSDADYKRVKAQSAMAHVRKVTECKA